MRQQPRWKKPEWGNPFMFLLLMRDSWVHEGSQNILSFGALPKIAPHYVPDTRAVETKSEEKGM